MANLINEQQETKIRSTFNDLVDTFPTPIKIYKYERADPLGPFSSDEIDTPTVYDFTAIREADKSNTDNEFRNKISEDSQQIEMYYIHYDDILQTDLINQDGTHNLTHNDLCSIHGEKYNILYANPIASMTTNPIFFQITVKRAFHSQDISLPEVV